MAKQRKTITVRLPAYVAPRNEWRRLIRDAVAQKQQNRGVLYTRFDRIEVDVKFHFDGSALTTHDKDNRVKDVFNPPIPNDRQNLATSGTYAFGTASAALTCVEQGG